MKGLKLRTMQSDVHLRAFRALGALPTPMAFAELYTALQTGTLDGQENAIAVMVPGRIYEVQKYLSPTQHVLTNIVMVLSLRCGTT
jgi:TRAP-type C4-dicarboxylate transport system substrate-binding protein